MGDIVFQLEDHIIEALAWRAERKGITLEDEVKLTLTESVRRPPDGSSTSSEKDS